MKNIAKAKRPLLPAEIVIKLVLPILIPSRNRYLSTSSFCWTPWHVCFAFAMSWIRLSAQHFDLSASGKRRNVPPDLIDYTEYPTDGCCCMVIWRCNTVFHNIYFVMKEPASTKYRQIVLNYSFMRRIHSWEMCWNWMNFQYNYTDHFGYRFCLERSIIFKIIEISGKFYRPSISYSLTF